MEAAFFDLDKTVINKASIAAFRRPFYQGGLISRRTVLRVLTSHLLYHYMGADERRMARMRESVLRLTKGWDEEEVRRIADCVPELPAEVRKRKDQYAAAWRERERLKKMTPNSTSSHADAASNAVDRVDCK